jgi:hypothetical protein
MEEGLKAGAASTPEYNEAVTICASASAAAADLTGNTHMDTLF